MFPPLAFPCHGKGKDALGDGEYDVQDLARDCIRSQRRALPWEREGEGRRKAEEAFFVDGNRVSFYSNERTGCGKDRSCAHFSVQFSGVRRSPDG